MTQKSFTFDHIFDQLTSQESLYRDSVAPLVERFLEGFNATVLAYGQTGSGKTFSMGIGLESVNTPANTQQGIVPRAVSEIFARIRQTAERDGDAFRAQVLVAFLELYNEELVDLLNPRPRTANLPASSAPTIREDGTGKIVWLNVREEEVKSPEELLGVLQRGTLCRTTGSTDMNATSSRSHAIFTVTLRQEKKVNSQPPSAPPVANDDAASTAMVAVAASASTTSLQTIVSKFHFVDLAGSERLKRTNAEGDRKKEGISINQGLLALGNVISALGDETRKAGHVPYRDSKLTRMLQDSLGGNSQTLMLACVSPSDLNYSETVNTLHYANRARNIKNRVVINQE
ncbi:P-loop containing nucleoside triphosphate hydrolase protein, partial [Entophlyctis helioformis]